MKTFYNINAVAATDKVEASAEIFIYAPIGDSWFEETITAKQFIKDLNALDAKEITVRINSVGGSVPDAIAIFNALQRHPATIITINDALAASAASLILMAGDNKDMAENAILMIHGPWTYAAGNSVEMRKVADMLDTWADAMASSYATATGKNKDEMLAMLTDGEDHWFTAAEAQEAGYVDNVTDALAIAASLDRAEITASIKDKFFKPAAINQKAAAIKAVKTEVAGATQQQETDDMNLEQIEAIAKAKAAKETEAKETEAIAAALKAEGAKAEAIRRADISAEFEPFAAQEGMAALEIECLADIKLTADAAGKKILAKVGEKLSSVQGGVIVAVEGEREKFNSAISNSLLARAGLVAADSSNQFRGYSLTELARASLEAQGVKTGAMDKMKMISAAFTHSTSDFTNLLADVANKAMMKGFEEAQETFQLFTTEGSLSDFKPLKMVDLDSFPALSKVPEGGEYKHATMGDRGESIMLATYGKKFSITRQAIINDDLDAFTKVPMRMGRAAIRTVGDLVYAILTGTHLMADGTTLFHANHKNLLTAAGISTASIDAMRVKMGLQKRGDATLNTRLKNIIVPLALEGVAKVVRDSQYEVGASKTDNTTPNSVAGTFEVISDARLDTASATGWYGSADQNVNDTIEVRYLDGNSTPTLEQQNGWDVDGVEFKVRMDAGVKAAAWEGLAKNAGV